MKQEYLLATVILGVDVYTDLEPKMAPVELRNQVARQSRYRILEALGIARPVW
jgi:hypothetical protein